VAVEHVPGVPTEPRIPRRCVQARQHDAGNVRVRNNVLGTLNVAAAGRYQTEKFVFVSSDKAVCPWLAEMLLMDVQQRWPETSFAAVRFGSVLGATAA
jgi:FlaA1/EpsC-like NDP-sugar epimerase